MSLRWEEIRVKANELVERVNSLITQQGDSDLSTSIPYFDMVKERPTETVFEKTKRTNVLDLKASSVSSA